MGTLQELDWSAIAPWAYSLIILQGLDIVMGLLCAFGAKTLSSSVSWKGISRKAGTLIVVAASAVIGRFLPQIPVVQLVIIGYLGSEGLSILENGAKLGLPIPQPMVDALAKLKNSAEQATVPAAGEAKP